MREICFFPAAQIVYRNVLGCTDALLTISHYLQKSLDAGMESYIEQLDFSDAFDRVSHSGLLFKFKSIGVGGSVLSISREFLSNHRQQVVVDGASIGSGFPSFLAYQREVCWVLVCLSHLSEKGLSWWRTDYMPVLMTPHY